MPGKEVSTREIVLDAFKQGKAVYVPYIYAVGEGKSKQKVMDMLRLRDQTDFDSLIPDGWGIPSLDTDSVQQRDNALGGSGLLKDTEPPANSSPDPDLIFMPAVAFDQSRNRLGHGKGFYDRYLQKYHKATARTERDMPRLGRLPSSIPADLSYADAVLNSRVGPSAATSLPGREGSNRRAGLDRRYHSYSLAISFGSSEHIRQAFCVHCSRPPDRLGLTSNCPYAFSRARVLTKRCRP